MQISREKLKKAALYILVILIIIRFILVPLYKQHEEKKDLLMKKIKNYETATTLYKVSKPDSSNNLSSKVYTIEDTRYIQTLILNYVEDYCKKNNIVLLNYDIPEPSLESKISEINIVLKLEGKPSQIVGFLKDMKKYPKIVDIKSFEAIDMGNKYDFTVVLATYKVEK